MLFFHLWCGSPIQIQEQNKTFLTKTICFRPMTVKSMDIVSSFQKWSNQKKLQHRADLTQYGLVLYEPTMLWLQKAQFEGSQFA